MAANTAKPLKSNKRKRIPPNKADSKSESFKSKKKTTMKVAEDSQQVQRVGATTKEGALNAKKKLKLSKVKPKKMSLQKQRGQHEEKKGDLSKREQRQRAKELAEDRKKKRKRHYSLEQELTLLWEKMRRRNISKEERSKLVTDALQKMKGTIPEIATSHVSSRVLQTCVKHCSEAERDVVYEELRPHFLALATSPYAVHLVTKMLDNASKSQLAGLISILHGHVASLLRHTVGSVVVEQAYQLGNATQKRGILMELYSTELQLFKDLTNMKETRLVEIISKLGLQKSSVLRHMATVLQPILEKGIVDHSIIHRALIEYLTIADRTSAADVVKQLSGKLLIRMIHTKDGSKLGMLCVKHGTAKERKKIVKGVKGVVVKTAHDHCGSMVLTCILSTIDDTKLLTKVVVKELQPALKELIFDKNGRRPLLQLLHPYCHRYFSPDELASINASIPSLCSKSEGEMHVGEGNQGKSAEVEKGDTKSEDEMEETDGEANEGAKRGRHQSVEGGKKDPLIRRQELLVKSGLAESLVDTCIENAEELLKSNFGKEVLYEVATGGADGILQPDMNDKLGSLYDAIAAIVAQPKSDDCEHILENFHSSRVIRKLVLDCPAFASILWKTALEGKSGMWAKGHSAKVVSAFLECPDAKVGELVKEELQPLVDGGILNVPKASS